MAIKSSHTLYPTVNDVEYEVEIEVEWNPPDPDVGVMEMGWEDFEILSCEPKYPHEKGIGPIIIERKLCDDLEPPEQDYPEDYHD